MTGHMFGIVVEALVAILLVTTIAYCILVNRKLSRLSTDQENLKEIIRELDRSTQNAENAIGKLKNTVETAEQELAERIHSANSLSRGLQQTIDHANKAASRLVSNQKLPDGRSHHTQNPPAKSSPKLDPEFSLRRLMTQNAHSGRNDQSRAATGRGGKKVA